MSSISSESILILFWMTRLSVSSLVSPGPLVPMPAPSLDSASPMPLSLEYLYLSCAISTCVLPSLVVACAAKISRISMVLSRTLESIRSDRFLSCDGDSSSSQMMPAASWTSSISRISSALPLPMYVPLSGCCRFCTTWHAVSPPAVSRSSASSSRDLHAFSSSPVATATRI